MSVISQLNVHLKKSGNIVCVRKVTIYIPLLMPKNILNTCHKKGGSHKSAPIAACPLQFEHCDVLIQNLKKIPMRIKRIWVAGSFSCLKIFPHFFMSSIFVFMDCVAEDCGNAVVEHCGASKGAGPVIIMAQSEQFFAIPEKRLENHLNEWQQNFYQIIISCTCIRQQQNIS